MASYIFDKILTQGVRQGQIPARTQEARTWYRDTASEVNRVQNNQILKGDQSRLTKRILPGRMYMFLYDPKTKADLPYYDRFPLIFPIAPPENGSFLGINMHYLPHKFRALLMDSLYQLATNTRYDETTRLRMSYDILNRARKFRYFKPCIKRYLINHTRSQFVYIYPSEWDIALFLPTERFIKARKGKVWMDSRKMLTNA